MQTYILMTKLSSDASRRVEDRAEMGRDWMAQVKEKCPEVKFVCHYALFGPYDFMDIYEAPDEETAAKVSMISMSHGALTAESWLALPYRKILELSREI